MVFELLGMKDLRSLKSGPATVVRIPSSYRVMSVNKAMAGTSNKEESAVEKRCNLLSEVKMV